MRWSGLAALAALIGCSSPPIGAITSFRGPTAVAVFSGWTHERPRQAYPLPQPYLAVANGRSGELRLIDLANHSPLASPGYAYPLSVPTLDRPSYLAASSLRDAGPDLLAVAGVGAVVDIVSTWEDGSDPSAGSGSRVVARYDLSGVAGAGAEILSMVATPVPGVPAGSPPVAPAEPGRAWLILGFSGSSEAVGGIPPGVGKLVVMEFVRGSGGSVELGAPVQAKPLQFDPVSLAVAPDLFHLYCATPDPVTDFTAFPPGPGARQVMGVAEVDMSGGAAGPWPVRGLDARAPTTLVAAAILGERVASDPDIFGPPVLRVYAALDPSGCGVERQIACGIAVIDPSLGGLAADLAPPGAVVPAQPYRAPLLVPAVPLTLSVALPAASGPLQCIGDADPCTTKQVANRQPLMQLLANGQRWTPAVAAVGASDGKTYLLDLGRSGPASDVSLLNNDNTRTAVVSAESFTPLQPDGSLAKAGLGLYLQYPAPDEPEEFTTNPTKLIEAVVVTPGFTRGEVWSLTWQGFLPGLAARSFVLGLEPDGRLYLAFQAALGGQWEVAAYVADSRLGIHPADLAQFTLPDEQFAPAANPCPLAEGTARHEAAVTSILPSTQDHPGGALELAVPGIGEGDPFQIECLRAWLAAQPPGGTTLLAGTFGSVRASGLVLAGSASGYAGRPPLLTKDDLDSGLAADKRFNFAWQDESALSGEALVLARKARRFFYANDRFTGAGGSYPESGGDPLAPGVALGFIAGPMCADEPPGTGLESICPPARMGDLLRDSTLVISTRSGVSPSYRSAIPLSLPSSGVAFDRSQFPDGGTLGSVVYVTCNQDAVLIAVPGQTPNISTTLR